MNRMGQWAARSLGTAALLFGTAATSGAAQDLPPCPLASDSVASAALGSPVHGSATPGTPPGFDICELGDFTVYRQSPDMTSNSGLPGLAGNSVIALPPEIAAQAAGLANGRTLDLPGYQFAAISGLGDAALWVKDASFGVDALLVQRGPEVFAFQVLDQPNAQAKTTALAQAVVANAPPPTVAVVPSGGRPAVITDCGLDVANAVADRLQRGDVSSISIIGGCHYVAIATTLDRSGFAAAGQICDSATEVAYSSATILGITVTDLAGHERASGANGEPCSAFP